MLSFDATFLVILLSFLVFMVAMRAVFFMPVARILAEREQRVHGDWEAIRSSQKTIDELEQAVEAGLSAARQRAQQLIVEAQNAAKTSGAEVIQSARLRSEQHLEQELADLKAQREQLYGQLSEQRPVWVGALLQKVLPPEIPAERFSPFAAIQEEA
jgi:F-type H+-transporting ATPase subunit b